MIKQKSCGGVVFTRDESDLRYVIIRQTNGVVCFPKGHIEDGESEEETAIREIKEETGLDVTLVCGFRECDTYQFALDDGREIIKEVVYFLCEFSSQQPVPQESELTEIYLLPYAEAREKLQFGRSREILDRANELLKDTLK